MFEQLKNINSRPEPFSIYTAEDLWTDEYTSKQMLKYHLNEEIDLSSRNPAFIDNSVSWIGTRFSVGAETRIVDFGCGPGLYTTRLAKLGATVTGLDFSRHSLEYAKSIASNEGLAINYIHQNYLEFATEERFDLAMMIMCDYCVLSPKQRKLLLERISGVLVPGGMFLFDVHSLNLFEQREESATYELNQLNSFWSPDDYFGFVNTFKYEPEKVILDKYTIIEKSRKRTVYNWLQHFRPEMIEAELSEYGFRVVELLGNVCGNPLDPESDTFAIVASRK